MTSNSVLCVNALIRICGGRSCTSLTQQAVITLAIIRTLFMDLFTKGKKKKIGKTITNKNNKVNELRHSSVTV